MVSNYLSTNIENHRQTLMGVGIISVLFVHLYYLLEPPPLISAFLKNFTMFIYVDGFLFLSGFGIYYSFSRNSNLKVFFKKRLQRLLVPYVFIMSLYIIVTSIIDKDSPGLILARIIGVSFWIEGNYVSTWYVHVQMLLYLLYPLFHYFCFTTPNKFYTKIIFGGGIYFSCCIALNFFSPEYLSMTSFALFRVPLFFMGASIAFGYKHGKSLVWVLFWMISYLCFSIANISDEMKELKSIYLTFFFLPIIVSAIDILQSNGWGFPIKICNWFGRYTLEIYLLHMMIANIFLRLGQNTRLSIIVGEILAVIMCGPIHRLLSHYDIFNIIDHKQKT